MRQRIVCGIVLFMIFVQGMEGFGQEEPPLPRGLKIEQKEPLLPPGLAEPASAEPALPPGLMQEAEPAAPSVETEVPEEKIRMPFNIYGFWEARAGARTQRDPHEDDFPLAENRLQLGADRRWEALGFKLVTDFIYDAAAEDHRVDLHRGEGWMDLREANITATPLHFMDLKLGRQVLTWGTGDLIFINDNFPKDFRSFFIGRDEEYLKAPSDALKASLFTGIANIDVVYTPRFDPDRFLTGERISFFNPSLGRLSGEDALVETDMPDGWLSDDELAARMFKTIKGYELALYGYDGFWKSPAGQNLQGQATFPALSVIGASVRGPVFGGIGNFETGYLTSRDDTGGSDPMIRNSEWRFLVGYERDLKEISKDLTLGLQYSLEYMEDYRSYLDTLPQGIPTRDEDRHLFTVRLTKLLMQQNLELSMFTFYSPSDQDAYIRPRVSYKVTDQWRLEAGGNIFLGSENHTFFGQFEDNGNIYAATRYSF